MYVRRNDVQACNDHAVSVHSVLTLLDQTGWCSSGAVDFIFGYYLVRILAVAPAIRSEIFRSHRPSCGIVPALDRDRRFLNRFQYVVHQSSYQCKLYSVRCCQQYELKR